MALVAWIGALCFLEWGIIHVMAMVNMCPLALRNDIYNLYVPGLIDLAPKADQEAFKISWPKYTGQPLFQHSYNLGWFGAFSFACCYWILVPNEMLPVLSLVPWLADVGYFLALDVPQLNGVVGQAQTYIITTACICGAIVTAQAFETPVTTLYMQVGGFSLLALACAINKIVWKCGYRQYDVDEPMPVASTPVAKKKKKILGLF